MAPKELNGLAELAHDPSDGALRWDSVRQLGGRGQDGSWSDYFQVIANGQRAAVDDVLGADHEGHKGVVAEIGDGRGGLDHAPLSLANHPFPWATEVRHLGRNEEEFDSKFVTYLFLQFLTEVRGEMIFFNPGQHFAASYESACPVAADGFWLPSSGNESLDGVQPGWHCQVGTGFDVDSSGGEAREE